VGVRGLEKRGTPRWVARAGAGEEEKQHDGTPMVAQADDEHQQPSAKVIPLDASGFRCLLCGVCRSQPPVGAKCNGDLTRIYTGARGWPCQEEDPDELVNLGELRQELLNMANESEASSPSPPEPSPESPPALKPLSTEFLTKEIEQLESGGSANGPRRVDWDLLLGMLIEYAPAPSRIVAANARRKPAGLTGA
jgi:hypothetical protein